MAHPDIKQPLAARTGVILDVPEQPRMAPHAHLRITELALMPGLDATAQLRRHGLHAVTDPQHRHAEIEYGIGHPRRLVPDHGRGPAREDHAARIEFAQLRVVPVPGMDLGIHAELPDPPRDQLRVLRTEIENQDALVVDIGHGTKASGSEAGTGVRA